jgi:glyoxylase-like metal-dependent hydrolase (beta-lactamase superfamily II)
MRIDRRQFIALSSGAVISAPLARVLAQATPPAPAFTDVRRNIGIFTARGGTIGWLINKDAVVVVDTQYADSAKTCLDGLNGKSGGRTIDLVFNTHHHADHTGGNAVFRAAAKKLVAQANVPGLQKQVASATPNAAPPVVADATFDKTWSEKVGDETIAAAYNGPGHTGGDAIVHFERAHVVHMGDLLFHEIHPRIDRPAGASVENWLKILDKVIKDMPADTIFIAGHARAGEPATVPRAAVVRFRDYFDAVLTLVRKGIASGQAKEAITATPLSEFENYQNLTATINLAAVLGVTYDELTAKSG